MYVIIGTVAVAVYTAILALGLHIANKQSKQSMGVILELKGILEEIKGILIEEETKMEKGNYKSTRSSEMVNSNEVAKPKTGKEFNKGLTLEHLITVKPTEENYETVINLLIKLVKETYNDYKFLLAKSTDETQQPHFLQIVSNWSENPEVHKEVFKKSIEYNLDMRTLQKMFAEKVASGEVLDLGDVVVITDDGSGQPPTGVSPINSGLEGGEIAFIISFLKKENYDDWYANTFPKEETLNE